MNFFYMRGRLKCCFTPCQLSYHPYISVNSARVEYLTLGRKWKVIPPLWFKGGGGGVDGTPPQRFNFLICCGISVLHWKAFDLLDKMRDNLWPLALRVGGDVNKHGRHLGFYQQLEMS